MMTKTKEIRLPAWFYVFAALWIFIFYVSITIQIKDESAFDTFHGQYIMGITKADSPVMYYAILLLKIALLLVVLASLIILLGWNLYHTFKENR